jgi:hypothetical protein
MRMKMRTTKTTMRRMSKIKAYIVLRPSSCAFRSWARAYARYLEMAMTRLIDWFSPHPPTSQRHNCSVSHRCSRNEAACLCDNTLGCDSVADQRQRPTWLENDGSVAARGQYSPVSPLQHLTPVAGRLGGESTPFPATTHSRCNLHSDFLDSLLPDSGVSHS